jgi:acetoin utilization deacetylase AcuC-like enzyme
VLVVDVDFHSGNGTVEQLESMESLEWKMINVFGKGDYPAFHESTLSSEDVHNVVYDTYNLTPEKKGKMTSTEYRQMQMELDVKLM